MMAKTGGYQTILVLEPSKGRAVVALANSQAQPRRPNIALHALVGMAVGPTPPLPPVPPPPTVHTEITLPATDLDKFVGHYDLGPGFTITVTRDSATLRVLRDGAPGGQALPVYPEGPTRLLLEGSGRHDPLQHRRERRGDRRRDQAGQRDIHGQASAELIRLPGRGQGYKVSPGRSRERRIAT